MSLSDFFAPVDIDKLKPANGFLPSQLGEVMQPYLKSFPLPGAFDLAIVGVEEDRNALQNKGCADAPDKVREKLYLLYAGDFKARIADLGNIKAGETVRDTYIALKTVVSEMIKMNVLPVIIGGGQDLTYAQYQAYEELERRVDLVVADAQFDLDASEEVHDADSCNYLNKIILHQPNYLFNYSNIGYQTYCVSRDVIRLMEKLVFDAHRLGEVRGSVQDIEPVIRNADLFSFDLTAIRQSDAPGNGRAIPNGFFAEEACQLCRYAGMSDKLSSMGFYEFNPRYDRHSQTANLLAQMIWCFIEGYYNRKNDLPLGAKEDFVKYRATFKDSELEVVFYKSKKTDRWWMQVPYPSTSSKNERYHLVPCTYKDYQTASTGEMPDRWWRTQQKLA